MPVPAKHDGGSEIDIRPIRQKTVVVSILGTRPLILNRQSEKAKRELLLPKGRKSAADRAESVKHDPLAEFYASAYRLPEDDAPTLLAALASWFKGAMMTAALDMPGVARTQIGRLLWVEGERLPLYGVPQLSMAMVRSAGIQRTPDVRTRCIVPRWAAEVAVTYVEPALTEKSVINLLTAAGLVAGVGDWRPEKGKGTFGQFAVTNRDDPAFVAIKEFGGRLVQAAAMADPAPYDDETADLLEWFVGEVARRGRGGQLMPMPGKEKAA